MNENDIRINIEKVKDAIHFQRELLELLLPLRDQMSPHICYKIEKSTVRLKEAQEILIKLEQEKTSEPSS